MASSQSLCLLWALLFVRLPPPSSLPPHTHTSKASSIFVAQVRRKETHKHRASIHARLCVGDACQLSQSVFDKASPAGVVGRRCSSHLVDDPGGAQRGGESCLRVHIPNLQGLGRNPTPSPEDSRYVFHDWASASPTQHLGCPTIESHNSEGGKDVVDLGS